MTAGYISLAKIEISAALTEISNSKQQFEKLRVTVATRIFFAFLKLKLKLIPGNPGRVFMATFQTWNTIGNRFELSRST